MRKAAHTTRLRNLQVLQRSSKRTCGRPRCGGCRREGDDGQCAAGSNGGCGPVADGDGDGDGDGLEGIGTDIATPRRKNARRPAGLCDGTAVDHTKNFDRWSELEEERTRSWRAGFSGTVTDVVDADAGSPQKQEGDVAIIGRRPEQPARYRAAGGNIGLFPPRPHDHDGWRNALAAAPELEPSFRRVADGLATRWTSLSLGLAWTGFACSETALCLWKQRMRSALSSLSPCRQRLPRRSSACSDDGGTELNHYNAFPHPVSGAAST